MSVFEIAFIDAVKDLGGTDWKDIFVSLAISIVSLWFTFKIAKYQIDTQLKKQNVLDLKKDRRMLSNQLILSKYEELSKALIDYTNLVESYYENTHAYFLNSIDVEKETQYNLTILSKITQKTIELKILMGYIPEIKEDLDDLGYFFCSFSKLIVKMKVFDIESDSFKYYFNLVLRMYLNIFSKSNVIRGKIELANLNILKDLE